MSIRVVQVHIIGEGVGYIFQDSRDKELFTGMSFRRVGDKLHLAKQPPGLGSAAERAHGPEYRNAQHIGDDHRDFRKHAFRPSTARREWEQKKKDMAR